MGLFYNGEFCFAKNTNHAAGIVVKIAESVGLKPNVEYSDVKITSNETATAVWVSVWVQNPKYELMHEFTKLVLNHSSELCQHVKVATHYIKGEL